MNTDTGRIYTEPEHVREAQARNEPLIRVYRSEMDKLMAMAPSERVEWAKSLPSRQQRRRALRKLAARGRSR